MYYINFANQSTYHISGDGLNGLCGYGNIILMPAVTVPMDELSKKMIGGDSIICIECLDLYNKTAQLIDSLDCPIEIEINTPRQNISASFAAKKVKYYLPVRIPKFLIRFFNNVIVEYDGCTLTEILY